LFLNISLKKRALQIGLPLDIDGPMKIQMASGFINYYKQVEACVRTILRCVAGVLNNYYASKCYWPMGYLYLYHVISSYNAVSDPENIVLDPKKSYRAVLHYRPIKIKLTIFPHWVAMEKMRNHSAIQNQHQHGCFSQICEEELKTTHKTPNE
jgi:hypothetical protein